MRRHSRGGKNKQKDDFQPLIDQMDEEGQSANEPQRIVLDYQNAAEMADLLSQIFTDPARTRGRRGGRGGGTQKVPPLILADDGTNSLIVRAHELEFNQIKKMVADLDIEDATSGISGVRLITVAQGMDVVELASMLERNIRDGERFIKAGNRNYKPKNVAIAADSRTNTLIVSGASSQFERVEEIVRSLEKLKPTGPQNIRIVRTGKVKAGDVKKVLDKLLNSRKPSRGGRRR